MVMPRVTSAMGAPTWLRAKKRFLPTALAPTTAVNQSTMACPFMTSSLVREQVSPGVGLTHSPGNVGPQWGGASPSGVPIGGAREGGRP
jgi:hypothetical protein